MIDMIKAEIAFKEYVNRFDINDMKVNFKIEHTYGVVDKADYIAKGLGLDEENVELAKLIALLHDIGRFEQATRYASFADGINMDHADFGVSLLFDEGLIKNFGIDEKYYDVIYKAVKNHNKFKIEDGLSEYELLHAKIIRDADKIDNFVKKLVHTAEALWNCSFEEAMNTTVCDEVMEDFLTERTVLSAKRKAPMDHVVSYIAWIYDLNFDICYKFLKENDSVNKLIDRFECQNVEGRDRMEIVRKRANEFIDSKIK